MEIWGAESERVKHNLATALTEGFAVKDPRSEIKYVKERCLMSHHRVLTLSEVEKIVKRKE